MQINSQYRPPPAPYLMDAGVPDEQKAAARSLSANLSAMHTHAENFGAAIALYQVSKANNDDWKGIGRPLFSWWMFMAAQQGVLEIYNYRMAMDAFMKLRSLCKAWSDTFENAKLEAAKDRFREIFPHTKEMRQSLMHKAELHRNPENEALNKLRPDSNFMQAGVAPNCSVVLTGGAIVNGRYSATYQGYDVGYALADVSIVALNENAAAFFSAVRNGRDERWPLELDR